MSEPAILVVGTSEDAAKAASVLLSATFSVMTAADLSDAATKIFEGPPDAILVDGENMDEPPWRLLEILRPAKEEAAILLLVSPATEWSALSAYRQRPEALVLKPLDPTALLMAVDSALVYRRLLHENRALKRQLRTAASLGDWVGCSPESQDVRQSIATAALATAPVTLIGEGGTGRRLAAELVHRHGKRPSAAFLPIDLASLPRGELRRTLEELILSCDSGRRSLVSGTRPGTLYLAEVTALAPEDQIALAAFLEDTLPFRLIVSAHPSIEMRARASDFDRETFSTLSKLQITLPPLRERRADIPVLIDHFLKRFCERFELEPLGMAAAAIESYSNYDWPGNVAELSMRIERAVSIASAAKFDGTTLPEHFCAPPSLTVPEPSRLKKVSLRELIADIEKRIILQTLERVAGSQKRAAEELRVNPTTLHEKMKRYQILPYRGRQET